MAPKLFADAVAVLSKLQRFMSLLPEDVEPIVVYDDWEPFDKFVLGNNEYYYEHNDNKED